MTVTLKESCDLGKRDRVNFDRHPMDVETALGRAIETHRGHMAVSGTLPAQLTFSAKRCQSPLGERFATRSTTSFGIAGSLECA